MSQFDFLKTEFAPVYEHAREAETRALSDPRGACFHARLALETAVHWMYRHDKALRRPYETHLAALIHEPAFRKITEEPIFAKARLIKNLGNKAVHEARTPPPQTAITAVRELFHVSYWFVRTYARGEKPVPETAFDPERLEKTVTLRASTAAAIKKQQEERDAALKELEAENKRLLDEIAKIKKQNAALPDGAHNYNEDKTRDAFIDLLLHEAGWPLNQERGREFEVSGQPTPTGTGYVDYVLWGDDGKPLGLVEAKRTKVDPRRGKEQAELYADALEHEHGQRPVIFYSNGYEHWMWDDAHYPPREVHGFLKKDELELMIQRRGGRGLGKPKRLIIEYVSALEPLDTVPRVKKHMALIQEIQKDGWWQDVTAPILDEARRKLRGLMSLAEIRRQQPVYTDFEDEIGGSEAADIRGAPAGVDTENFRKKAEQFLKPHENHITILKLRRNEVLTPQDLAELERIFTDAGAGPGEIEKVKKEEGGLGLFVRSLNGLDQAAAKKAFDGFIAERSFVNMIIEHLTAQGVMTPGRLYESPFTDIHSRGADGVFESADVTALTDILNEVRARAAA